MAADANRLAAALAYEDDRKRRLAETIPTLTGPTTAPRRSVRTDLENLSAGLGQGITTQLEGIKGLITDPVGTAKGAYEAARAVVRDPSVLAAALSQMGQKAMSGPLGAGEVIGEMIGPRKTGPVMAELDVYHGTPHRFPGTEANPLGEFDASKIGTGEGAQAFGHGIYLAEKPTVAQDYQFMLSKIDPNTTTYQGKPVEKWYEMAQTEQDRAHRLRDQKAIDRANAKLAFWENVMTRRHPEDAKRVANDPDDGWPTLANYANSLDMSKFGGIGEAGSLYKADLPDEMIDRMLDWDKPLSEQPAAVREALKRRITSVEPTDKFDMGGNSLLRDNRLGQYDKTRADPWILEASGANGTSAFGLSQKDVDRMFGSKDVANLTGEQIISRLAQQQGGQAAASKYLADLGIPGIKYLDAGSRGQGGSGTRNFVVFPGEEKKVRILERDGQKAPPQKIAQALEAAPRKPETPVAHWNADKTVPASSIVELHGVRDKKKRDALQTDMELRGWSGRPLLAYRDDSGAVFALTGSHRLAAARAADIDVPIALVSDASMQHVDEIGRYLPEIAGRDDDDVLQFLENAGDKRSAELMRLEVRFNNERK
jgi:hypothetical protein